ncbi:MAG: hypothetical protein FJ295_07370 [Planctomycetes bacterium]|nr:hypothetical protein [Planctomycetota bacterium]
MKRVCVALLVCFVLVALSGPAWAIPPFKKGFDDVYGKNADIKKASDEAKCNVCHFGMSKKMKNDYGKALAELLKKDKFKEDRIKAEPDAVKKEIEEALKKVEDQKSKDGEKFGDRLKANKLPGTPES